jgi:hypothetical protein
VNWSWLIPLSGFGRQLAPVGFQVCPYCLSSGEPCHRWQWRIALFFRCTEHGCLLVDHCPQCGSRIHPYALSLLGLRRACGDVDGKLERCDRCSFDLRNASTNSSRASSTHTQKALQLRLALSNGTSSEPTEEYFAVLRHIIDLLAGENTGLEDLRVVIARHSGMASLESIPDRSTNPISTFHHSRRWLWR